MKTAMVEHTCNPIIHEVEAGRSRVQGQLGVHGENTSLLDAHSSYGKN
jgi:hypothetical protein